MSSKVNIDDSKICALLVTSDDQDDQKKQIADLERIIDNLNYYMSLIETPCLLSFTPYPETLLWIPPNQYVLHGI